MTILTRSLSMSPCDMGAFMSFRLIHVVQFSYSRMHPCVWCVIFLLSSILLYPQMAFMDLPLINILDGPRLSGGIIHASLIRGYSIKMVLEAFPWILGGSLCKSKESPRGMKSKMKLRVGFSG